MTIDSVDDELRELLEILALVFRSLRKHGPDLSDVEPLKHAFFEAGLRERHGRLILALAVGGPQTVGELAGRLALAPATTSLLVGELDRAGFVERHEDEADRRRTIVSLPETVRGPAEKFAQERLEPLRRTLEQLSPVARRHFIQGLRILSKEAAPPEPGEAGNHGSTDRDQP
jgi:DNA-binding MarR family transcriptional regulator